ncbi:MAG: RagB/SusD family nutrient uptake outer membrane protein, partial [Duncaniella sp.]|nr:RagB/SusD family nutrient uptake outer membrane protein [Duncaniella sp.]
YTGEGMWQECADLCNDIRTTISTLAPEYKYLFCATNDKYVGNGEILWAVPQDVNSLYTYGGTTYLAVGAYNGEVDVTQFGLSSDGWGGPRVRPELSQALEAGDKRRLIYEGEMEENLTDLNSWKADGSGYMCIKYVYTPESNYDNADGTATQDLPYNSTDFPLFRLADTYLMLAECEKHGATGCNGLDRLNDVRQRAGLDPVGAYTLDDILKERLCELYWEGHRRSDLIRFGKFSGSSYVWQWKGGLPAGAALDPTRDLMAIPAQFVPTLGQNPGYVG